MLTKIYHKKNELFQVEFYQDEKCQQAFDFTNAETSYFKCIVNFENLGDPNNFHRCRNNQHFYIELKDGDISPLTALNDGTRRNANIYIPYIPQNQKPLPDNIKTLDDIVPNLSKYIPENNAVLFLSEEEANKHSDNCESWFLYQKDFPTRRSNSEMDIRDWKAITIFLPHGTEFGLKKVSKIAQELKQKYGFEKVNVFVLHCFGYLYGDDYINVGFKKENNFPSYLFLKEFIDKVIATNSTGISEPQDEERLQILDCYNIFNNHLKGE